MGDANSPVTAEFARNNLGRRGIGGGVFNFSDLDAVEQAVTPSTRLLLGETPANPAMRITDIQAVAEIAHQSGARLAIDSTFATPIATQPLTLGADYVIPSLPKYFFGNGYAIGGPVLTSKADTRSIETDAKTHIGGLGT